MTPSELKTAALLELKVIASGEQPNTDDFTLMGQKYAGLHAMLLTKTLTTWALTEDVPAAAEQPVVMMLAAFSANAFGVPQPRISELLTLGGLDMPTPSLAERQLRKVLSAAYVSHPVRTTYY